MTDESPLALLAAQVDPIVKGLQKQLHDKNSKVLTMECHVVFWLVVKGQVTRILVSNQLSEGMWLEYWLLTGCQRVCDYNTGFWLAHEQ